MQRLIAPQIRRRVLAGLVARDVLRQGLDACWQRFVGTLDALEARSPAHGYWIGPRLSVADVAIFAQLHSLRTPLTPAYAEDLGKRRRLSSYLDRVDGITARTERLCQPAA
ncbi:MAG TPA: glutathione S-transferase domain-containing protein [Polyangiales bacterium]|nr:glutathione S-transferase domain-containing protein [Polyangiales bacterium]